MNGSRSVVGATVAAAVMCALLASSIMAGLHASPVRPMSDLPAEAALDYDDALVPPLAPLRRDFVREALGLTGTTPSRDGAANPARARPGPALGDVKRLVVVHPFSNDHVANAVVITGLPFTGQTNTGPEGGSREDGEQSGCGSVGGTAWYRFRSPRDQSLVANTFGSDYALGLSVFQRSGDDDYTLLGCDSDLRGAALVQFDAVGGTTYWFQIAAEATGGQLVFNLEPTGVASMVSVTPSGEPGSRESYSASVSADGRYVAFESYAPDLTDDPALEPCHAYVPTSLDDARSDYVHPCRRIYVRDRVGGKTHLVSVSSDKQRANNGTFGPWISGNGRYVVFDSAATNLVEGDTNGVGDIFVHDLHTGRTERVSISSEGVQAEAPNATQGLDEKRPMTGSASLTDDGRYVAFFSEAANLVEGDTNQAPDVFVHDRATGRTERVSVTSGGRQTGGGGAPAISADGRYVTFRSAARDIVPVDTKGFVNLYVHDRLTGATEIVSVSSGGNPGDAGVDGTWSRLVPLISTDGRFVVFGSKASDLVPGDTNDCSVAAISITEPRQNCSDVFVRDRARGTTVRVSVSSQGVQGNDASWDGTITRDGRYVAFASAADRLDVGARTDAIPYIEDLYVHDLVTRTTVRMPVTPRGLTETPGSAKAPFLSADGATIVFVAVCYDFACGNYGNLSQVWALDRPGKRSS